MKLEPLEIKTDDRGSLVEAFKFPNDGQLFYVIIKPNQTRGNHYHTHKIEHFLVIYGSAVIQVKNRETGDVMKLETNGSRPIAATIVPEHIHNITANSEGCILLVWANEHFDPKDPDTFGDEI